MLLVAKTGFGEPRVHFVHRISEHDDNSGTWGKRSDFTGSDLRCEICSGCFSDYFLVPRFGEARQVFLHAENPPPVAQKIAGEELRLLYGRHEDLGMLTQISIECRGAALWSADDKQIGLLHFDLNEQRKDISLGPTTFRSPPSIQLRLTIILQLGIEGVVEGARF